MAKSGSGTVVEQRRERWRELLRRWRASGLSQAEFCRRHGIAVWKLAWWRKRLGEVPCDRAPRATGGRRSTQGADLPAAFVPVGVLSAPIKVGRMELVLGRRRRLRFSVDVDPARLATLVAALERVTAADKEGPPC